MSDEATDPAEGLAQVQRFEAECIAAARAYEGIAGYQRRMAAHWREQAAWWGQMCSVAARRRV